MKKLAIKRLTASDLTFFHWHFVNKPAGNQKAINLNASTFVKVLYPSFPDAVLETDGRAKLDLYFYGPGLADAHNLQRKILRQQKNWRLNGEFVNNPIDDPERYNCLSPGDILVMEFVGGAIPTGGRFIWLAKSVAEDNSLQTALDSELGSASMKAISASQLTRIVENASPLPTHPINNLLLDEAIEDVALGGNEGASRLLRGPSRRVISKDQLNRAKRNADDTGRRGEELVNSWFEALANNGEIKSHQWTADINAISPFDFEYTDQSGNKILLDVKSTGGDFERTIHISLNELLQMADPSIRYDLYRIYDLNESSAKLRIAEDIGNFAREVITALGTLPNGVIADGVSVKPTTLNFGNQIIVEFPDLDE